MGTAVLGPLAQKTSALLSRPPCRLHPPPSVPLRSAATRHDSIAERPSARMAGPVQTSDGERAGGQRRGLRSERPQNGGSIAIPPGPSEEDPGALHPATRTAPAFLCDPVVFRLQPSAVKPSCQLHTQLRDLRDPFARRIYALLTNRN